MLLFRLELSKPSSKKQKMVEMNFINSTQQFVLLDSKVANAIKKKYVAVMKTSLLLELFVSL